MDLDGSGLVGRLGRQSWPAWDPGSPPGTSTITVVTDEAGMRTGDCVAVERGAYVNLRLAPDARCAKPAKPPPSATREATACEKAKDEVLNAKDDAAFDRAERKMRLLCAD